VNITVEPGKYVVAVSGGVDSVVLLDLLSKTPDLELIVAHYDHGIRKDSTEDRQLVATLSQKYDLPYEFTEGELGLGTSEEAARVARYDYLRHICNIHKATGVVTAHHQDDALETLAFNILRGTNRKGMSSLQSSSELLRPLLGYTKEDIMQYAQVHHLQWREDSTNQDEKYTRNWIRRSVLPKLSRKQRRELRASHEAATARNAVVDGVIQQQLTALQNRAGVDRKKFTTLPYSVACEVMAAWLRQQGIENVDSKLVHMLTVGVKTLPPGRQMSVAKGRVMIIEPALLRLP
jgi:tRNA(Ile)-lysidine synthase